MAIEKILFKDFEALVPRATWGETAYYYNPGHRMKWGTYFLTYKEKDGPHDTSSSLDRPGIFRLSWWVPREVYEQYFGSLAKRPQKGRSCETGYDYTRINTLMPHPVYAWVNWLAILNPTASKFYELLPLIRLSYQAAQQRFAQREGTLKSAA
jgi:hypothetical protein